MTPRTQARAGPPLGRHVAAVGLTAALTLVLFWLDANPDGGRALPLSHQVLADTSLVLLCLILLLGAGARFVPRLRPAVPWGRELGIAMFVTGGLHALILFGPELRVFAGLVGESRSSGFEFWTNMWAAANWVGLVALMYTVALALTSNDWSQRFLGRGWKFLQRQAYTLFVLVWLHTAAFVLIGAGHGAAMTPRLFWGVTGAAVIAQFAGYIHTVRARRRPSEHRVPPRGRTTSITIRSRAARWIGVVTVWTVFVAVSWWLTTVESQEEIVEARQVALLCDRYNELGRPPITGTVRNELIELLPPDWEPADVTETAQTCATD